MLEHMFSSGLFPLMILIILIVFVAVQSFTRKKRRRSRTQYRPFDHIMGQIDDPFQDEIVQDEADDEKQKNE